KSLSYFNCIILQLASKLLDQHLFFFSSRRRHTRFSRDWSSDVCSSDLSTPPGSTRPAPSTPAVVLPAPAAMGVPAKSPVSRAARSEERRVGKERRSRWAPQH